MKFQVTVQSLSFRLIQSKEYVPRELSRDDATKLYQIIPNISKAVRIAEKIIPLNQKLRKQYLRILGRHPKSPRDH